MSGKVLKTTLLSLAAASLLTTSAYAAEGGIVDISATGITGKISERTDKLTKEAGTLEIADIVLSSVDYPTFAKEITFTVKRENNSTTSSFLTSFNLYKGQVASSYIIGSATAPVIPANSILSYPVTVSVNGNVEVKKDDKLFLGLNYASIPDTAIKDINITFSNMKVLEQTTDANNTVDVDLKGFYRTFEIDREKPTATKIDTKLEGQNNTFTPTTNRVSIHFDEQIRSLPVTDLTKMNTIFSIKDGKGDSVAIEKAVLDQNATDANLTLTLSLYDLNTSVSGDIFLTYNPANTASTIKDIFGNDLNISFKSENNLTKSEIFEDTKDPEIQEIVLDFDDASKGHILFSEEVDSNNTWNTPLVFLSYGLTRTEVNATLGTPTVKENKTYIPFTLSAPESGTVLFKLYTDNNASIHDFGEHNMTSFVGESITKTQDFYVVTGWNLIALDKDTRSSSKRVLSTGNVETIWSYDVDGTWTKFPADLIDGKGYWVKVRDGNTSHNLTIEHAEDDKAKAFYDGNDSVVIKNANTSDKWELLGLADKMDLKDAYNQINSACSGLSLFAYDVRSGDWNGNTTDIPANSGIWVKQENCK
jgi:hypothetical protein